MKYIEFSLSDFLIMILFQFNVRKECIQQCLSMKTKTISKNFWSNIQVKKVFELERTKLIKQENKTKTILHPTLSQLVMIIIIIKKFSSISKFSVHVRQHYYTGIVYHVLYYRKCFYGMLHDVFTTQILQDNIYTFTYLRKFIISSNYAFPTRFTIVTLKK